MISEVDTVAYPPSSIGRYRITGELGRGGMGVVFRAVDPQLDRPVAVKRISLEASEQVTASELEERFLREARLAARLHHAAVATVFDAGRDGDSLYLVMELVEGQSLQRRLARGQFPSAREALEIAAQVADALGAAHEKGIIHRDVKPANILLTEQGTVKVSDFGVAKAVGEATDLTRSGTVLGSPAYMAPEQIQGTGVDARADLFSLGVVLYEMLLHRRPFPADTVTTLIYQILHQDPLDDPLAMRALGADLAAFLRLALAKDPADRVADATAFARRARELAQGMAAGEQLATGATVRLPGREPAFPVPAPPSASKPSRPARLAVLGGAALVGILVLAGVYALLRRPPAPAVGRSVEAEPRSAPATLRPEPAAAVAVAQPAETRPTRVPPPAPVIVTPPPAAEPDSVVNAAPVAEVRPETAAASPTVPKPVAAPGVVKRQDQGTRPPLTTPSEAPRAEPPAVVAPAPAPQLKVSEVFRCRKGAEFNVSPEEAVVTINGRRLGIADDWDGKGGGKKYMFAGPGTYDVILTLEGYETTRIQIVVSPDADDDIADVDTDLEEVEDR